MKYSDLETAVFDEPAGHTGRVKARLKLDYEQETSAPNTDSLTALFNHGFFQIFLEQEVKRSKRYGNPFTLGLLDIDSFAGYNKLYGSVKGDRILKEVAKIIRDTIRQSDIAARYSGNTFAVIMINSDVDAAYLPMERVMRSVEALTHGDLTISIGLAGFPREAVKREGLIRKAETVLTEAKLKGKNRICFFEKNKPQVTKAKPRILVVDDDPRNVRLMQANLKSSHYEMIKAYNGEDALSIIKRTEVDLILLDIMMPGMDGYEVCSRLKGSEATRLIPVIMITALDDLNAKVKGIDAGADDFITKPPNKVELMARINSLLKIKTLNKTLTSIENVLISLANAVEAKDVYTQGHVFRVSNMAANLAKSLGLSDEEIYSVKLGGILHDIGKIGIPREILNKPGTLNAVEWNIIKSHPKTGQKICSPLKKTLGSALEIIRHHHEKIDGSGYPDGLKGDEIPFLARVMAVIDIFDALTTDRPYRKKLSEIEALTIICGEADDGKLDQEIVKCFVKMVDADVSQFEFPKRLDQALYSAKHAGKNPGYFFDGGENVN